MRLVTSAFLKSKKSCCICCGKRNYEKNDYQFDITSENGIENKEWIFNQGPPDNLMSTVLSPTIFGPFDNTPVRSRTNIGVFSFMTASENFYN